MTVINAITFFNRLTALIYTHTHTHTQLYIFQFIALVLVNDKLGLKLRSPEAHKGIAPSVFSSVKLC